MIDKFLDLFDDTNNDRPHWTLIMIGLLIASPAIGAVIAIAFIALIGKGAHS